MLFPELYDVKLFMFFYVSEMYDDKLFYLFAES